MSDGLRLLSSIIANQSSGTLLRLDREVFIEQELDVYDFLRDHFRTYRELPQAQTVLTETSVTLPRAPEALQFYVDSVEDRHSYNLVRDHYANLRAQLAARDMEGMAETVAGMSHSLRRNTHGTNVMSMGEGLGLVLDRIDATRGLGGMTGIESGWPGMDEITGGYQDADIITVVARPALGKTYNLLKQAQHAHQSHGKSVLIVTTEMGIEQIARRYASLELGINPDALKHNMVDTYMERRIRTLHQGMLANDRFKIFSVGMHSKVNAIEALLQEFGPDILYIDGAYLLHPSVKGTMKRIERVGEVYDELKGLNLQVKIPFVVTMQFNRQAGKDGKDASLETIGFSDAVGMHSSLVMSLKYGPTADPKASRTLEFMKGREGESGSVSHYFKFAPVDFSEIPQQEVADMAREARTGAEGDGGDNNVWRA